MQKMRWRERANLGGGELIGDDSDEEQGYKDYDDPLHHIS